MYETAGLTDNDDKMTFESFAKIFASEEYAKTLEHATLVVDSKSVSFNLLASLLQTRQLKLDTNGWSRRSRVLEIIEGNLKSCFGRYHHTLPYHVSVITVASDICRS